MKQIKMLAEQKYHKEQGIDIKYIEVEGKRSITVYAKEDVVVNVTLATMIYRNIVMHDDDALVVTVECGGQNNLCSKYVAETNAWSKVSPTNVSGEFSWVIQRADVEYDVFREEDPYVVEAYYNECLEEFTFVTFNNDRYLTGRPITDISIDPTKWVDSSVLKLISSVITTLGNKRICLDLFKREKSNIIAFEFFYNKKEIHTEYDEFEVMKFNFNTSTGELSSWFSSDETIDSRDIIRHLELIDLQKLDSALTHHVTAHNILEIK